MRFLGEWGRPKNGRVWRWKTESFTSNRIGSWTLTSLPKYVTSPQDHLGETTSSGLRQETTTPVRKPDLRKTSELFISFKDPERDSISLSGEEADAAWKNFKKAAGSTADRTSAYFEELSEPKEKS